MRRVRTALILLIMLLSPAMLFAEYEKTFSWQAAGDEVLLFRYQLDGEKPSGWTLVSAEVTSCTLSGLTGEHVLYVQQSVNGTSWSASSRIYSKEPEPGTEEVLPEEPVTAVITYTYPRPEQVTLSLLYGVGSLYYSGYDYDSFVTELSVDLENVRANGHFGLDIRADVGADFWFGDNDFRYYFMPLGNLFDASAYSYSLYADLEGGLNFSVENAILYIAAGPRLQINFGSYDTEGAFTDIDGPLAFKWGATADAGVRFGFTRHFSAGAEVSYTFLFDDTDRHYIDYKLLLAGSI